jgi:hypothetical protein
MLVEGSFDLPSLLSSPLHPRSVLIILQGWRSSITCTFKSVASGSMGH